MTHHAHVLVELAKDPDLTVAQLADVVGISSRATVTILNDLVADGYVERERQGRRNHYVIHGDVPLRHPANATHTLDELIRALTVLPTPTTRSESARHRRESVHP